MKRAYALTDAPVFNPGCNGGMVLVIDTTGSMSGVMYTLTEFLVNYMQHVFAGQISRVGLVCMGDHGEAIPAVAFCEKTHDWSLYQRWLRTMPHTSGGDGDEAVACCIQAARDLDPEASIWLVTDALGHGMGRGSPNPRCYGNGDDKGCGKKLNLEGVNVILIGSAPTDLAAYHRYNSGPVFATDGAGLQDFMDTIATTGGSK